MDYALGILVEPDLGRALTRIKQDMDFGHLVSRYVDQFSAGVPRVGPIEDTPIAPRSQILNAILTRISKVEHF